MSSRRARAQPQGAALARIRGLEGSLTPSERAVARLVLSQPDEVLSLSVEALAARAGVSTATVMRLCQSLGFSGFKEFKLTLALERGTTTAAVLQEEIRAEDTPVQVARKVLASEALALQETLDLLDERALERAVAALAGARSIEIYGMGSSAPVVVDAYYRFRRLGLRASTPPDSHMQVVTAALLGPGDVVLVISHTGRTREVVATARRASEAGATVIALTSFLRSPLLGHADIHLVTAVREATSRVEAMAARTAHLAIIDTLYVALALRLSERAQRALEQTQEAIDGQRL